MAKGKWKEAQQLALVDSKAFGNEVADVESYAGFFTVNVNDVACQSNLFFWFFPAEVSAIVYSVIYFIVYKRKPLSLN